MPDSQPKKKRGQKICPKCNCVNGVRSFVCKNCDHEFKMKKGRRGPRKIPVKNHQSLIKGDKIRVVGGSGPFYTDRYGESFGEKFNVLYDKKGRSYLNKLAKKYGLTVETKPLKIRSDNEMFEDIDETFYVLKFNDKLKKDIAKNGLPQFAEGGLVNAD